MTTLIDIATLLVAACLTVVFFYWALWTLVLVAMEVQFKNPQTHREAIGIALGDLPNSMGAAFVLVVITTLPDAPEANT